MRVSTQKGVASEATGKHRLADSDISPRLVKWDRLISVGFCIIFMLIIGISYINVAAGRSIFILLGVFGFITQFVERKLQ